MDQHALSALSAWENFYVIIGSSAGALTGLQFVVIALAALQWRGVRWGSRFQQFSTALKGLGFFAVVIACFFFAPSGSPPAFTTSGSVPHGWPLFVAFLLAMQSMIYTYDG